MKKALIIGLLVSVAVATNAHAWDIFDTFAAMEPQADIPPITFRGLDWFSDVDAIFEHLYSEGFTNDDMTIVGDNILTVEYKVAGFKATGGYTFDPDTGLLVVGFYDFLEEHTDEQQYYLDFLELQEALCSVYGDVTMVDDQWINDLYKDNEPKYGMSVQTGKTIFCRGWKASDGSAVILEMSGDNYDIFTSICYFSPGVTQERNTDGL